MKWRVESEELIGIMLFITLAITLGEKIYQFIFASDIYIPIFATPKEHGLCFFLRK